MRRTTGALVVILEADEDGDFSLVSVNGKKHEGEKRVEEGQEGVFRVLSGEPGGFQTLELVEIRKVEREVPKPTDEQCLLDEWSGLGTDLFWDRSEPPDMKGMPYLRIVGYLWWEYSNTTNGADWDGGFEIVEMEPLDKV